MKKQIILILAVVVSLFATSLAQKNDYSSYSGYIDFGDLGKFESGEEVTEVLIEEHLIRMVAKLAKSEEPEVSSVLEGLKLIKVHTFGVSDNNTDELKIKVESIDDNLMNRGWDRIVKTKSKNESTNVYILATNEEKIAGLKQNRFFSYMVINTLYKAADSLFEKKISYLFISLNLSIIFEILKKANTTGVKIDYSNFKLRKFICKISVVRLGK